MTPVFSTRGPVETGQRDTTGECVGYFPPLPMVLMEHIYFTKGPESPGPTLRETSSEVQAALTPFATDPIALKTSLLLLHFFFLSGCLVRSHSTLIGAVGRVPTRGSSVLYMAVVPLV